jgi:hypothetical protein
MIINKDLGLFKHTESYEYTPSYEELYFWYSGTHAGYTRDNPYHRTHGMTVTKRRHTQVIDLITTDSDKHTEDTLSRPKRRLA